MKVAIVILAITACVLARQEHHDDEHLLVQKQKDVLEIVKYIHNPIYHEEHAHIAKTYSLEANAHHYKNGAYQHFARLHKDRLLKKGEIFSIFNVEHAKQAEALFKLFYHADSYQTFHHTALWARHHLNEGLFLYTYCVAIVHREDTQGLSLPPIYEIYPHYFFNSEVIHKAYKLKMVHSGEQVHQHEQTHHDHQGYTIHANYSGHYLNLDPEQSLSYYLEDVGMGEAYFYFNIYYPHWISSEEFQFKNPNRGEVFYYVHKQLLARYHLERLSHGLGEVEFFNWDLPFKTGYFPSLVYPNGLAFPERPHFANLREYLHHYGERRCDKSNYGFAYTYVQTYEQRIREAVDSGFVIDHEGKKHPLYTQEGINILGNLIQGNADSVNHRYYGSFVHMARHLLGYSKEPLDHHKLAPSALEHLSTSLRDPAFYQIFKKVLLLVEQYKQNLPLYHHEHLHHEGLEVQQVEVEPLVTFYDDFYADITNGLFVTPEEYERNSFRVKVHQYRLNHKNFNYKVHVKSQKDTKAVVKVFIGPKYDEHGRTLHLSQVYDRMFQLDQFVHELKAGNNVVKRNSADCVWFSKDHTSYFDALKHVKEAEHSGNVGFVKEGSIHSPMRLKLPRGSEDGTSFQLYVIVYPYTGHEQHQTVEDHQHSDLFDKYPMGYPFDRPTEHVDNYHVPNAFVKHVKIYHIVNRDLIHHDEDEQHHGQHQNFLDEHHLVQHGDHNNYYQYHYQHQDVDHDVHHEETQQHQHGEHVVDHSETHPQMDVKTTKSHQSSGLSYKRFFQDFQEPLFRRYYGEHQVPKINEKHQIYHDNVPSVYAFGNAHGVKYHDADYTPYQWNHQENQIIDEDQLHNQQKHFSSGKTHGIKYHDEDHTPYQWKDHDDGKVYHGSNYQSTEDEHHYEPHHHYFSNE